MAKSRFSNAVFLLVSILSVGPAHASQIVNGNFTPDFAPWQGIVENANFDASPANPDADARFSLIGGGMAQFETAPAADPTDNIITVDLYQTFFLPASARWIEFDYAWAMSDPSADFVEAFLENQANPGLYVDLFAGLDILQPNSSGRLLTAVDSFPGLAGFDVRLTFRVGDGGDDVRDSLAIGNIRLVPVAGTLPLLGLGLIGWLLAGRVRSPRQRQSRGGNRRQDARAVHSKSASSSLIFARALALMALGLVGFSAVADTTADWTDISDELTIATGSPHYSRAAGQSLAQVTLSVGNQPVTGPVRLVVTSSSSPVLNADGTTSATDPNPNAPFVYISAEGLGANTAPVIGISFQRSRARINYSVAVENDVLEVTPSYVAPPFGDESTGLNRWFVLINGAGPVTDASPQNPPLVLTVDGQPSAGAPSAPNGGIGVGVQRLPTSIGDDGASVAALWRAVPSASGAEGEFYLRSAQSFQVADQSSGANNQSINYPSPLLGYAQSEAPLNLGYVPGFATHGALYWDQSGSPSGDNSAFHTWTYDTTNGTLTQPGVGQLRYDSNSTAPDSHTLVESGSATPEATWSIWPDYSLSRLLAQPQSDPPFTLFTGGALAAYNYLSSTALVKSTLPTCTIGGLSYSGIRCNYTVQNDLTAITNCTIIALQTTYQTQYEGVAISAEDWQTMRDVMYPECSAVSQAMQTFGVYNDIYESVFAAESDLILPLANDIKMSTSTQINTTAIDIVEGMLYTLLSATGDPAAGVVANMMSSAVTDMEDVSSITTPISVAVSDLYSQLAENMAAVQTEIGEMFNTIVQDSDKLRAFYLLSIQPGYNSLGITADVKDDIEADAVAAFKVAAMQVLMASYYTLWQNPALTDDAINSYFERVPASASLQYGAFGDASDDTYNYNYLIAADDSGFPDDQVVTTDVLQNGGNAFELFNAVNGWRGIPLIPSINFGRTNLGCSGVIFVLFNATPDSLIVTTEPSQGKIAAPGYSFNSNTTEGFSDAVEGSESASALELWPYGYLPIWATAYGGLDNNNLTILLSISSASSGAYVGSIEYGGDGCRSDVTTAILDSAFNPPWQLSEGSARQQAAGFYPAGLSATIWSSE